MAPTPYEALRAHATEIALLESSAAVLHWDQETMMPPGGVEHRARQLAQLAEIAHERAVVPQVGEWLAACEGDQALTADPDSDAAVNVRQWRRSYDRSVVIPTALVSELASTTSLAQRAWSEARQASDFAQFQPWLEKLLDLSRKRAECLGWPEGGEPFDALLEDYEPGATAAEIQQVFDPLRARLTELLGDLRDNGTPPDDRFLALPLPIAKQEEFVRAVVERLGFDFTRGRLDRSAHPFSIGTHITDVRITTRFADDNLLDALGSTMHEAGHGMYEQGLPTEHTGTPLASAISLGIHESQSRLWENQVGRSHAFWTWCHPLLGEHFGASVREYDLATVYGAANRVQPSTIRVEADEATYNLHVMIRFELELRLLRGDLEAAAVPAEWNRLYAEYLGVTVPNDAEGCLQDVHWSGGMFGYFPTYTLGNLYASQLFATARSDLPDLDEQFARGEFGALKRWLNERVHAHGQRYPAPELCRRVCGAPLSAEPFLDYLETKLRAVYRL